MGITDVLSSGTVDKLLFEQRQIVIYDGYVLQLDGWLNHHPGGRLAILHMVGRDATSEINIYHSSPTLQSMRKYAIGKIAEPWVNKTPPIRGGVFLDPDQADHLCSDTDLSSDSDGGSSTGASSSGSSIFDSAAHTGKPLARVSTGKKHEPSSPASKDPYGKRCVKASLSKDGATLKFVQKTMQDEIDDDIRDYPSLDYQTQRDIEAKYRLLQERVEKGGFYQCPYIEYGKEMARYLTLFTLSMTALVYGWYWTSAAMLGLFWHQIMFTAHDAGHQGITQNFVLDRLIGIFIADFCCGLSIGWWSSSHNVHHLVTNHTEHDPDIQNVPLFATCPSFFASIHSSYYDFTFVWDKFADYAVRYQKYTYYPVMAVARFNLYILSIHHLIMGPRPVRSVLWIRKTELTCIACYWFLFGYCLLWRTLPDWPTRVAYVLISHIVTTPLHVQITLSHWGMSTADLGETESFPQRQLRTTMDVDCPPWLDFIHGGLQFQAVHHLFPRVSRHNLRRLQTLVREFCQETGIKYSILSFSDGNKKVLGRLGEITAQMEAMLQCQKYMAETGESGLH